MKKILLLSFVISAFTLNIQSLDIKEYGLPIVTGSVTAILPLCVSQSFFKENYKAIGRESTNHEEGLTSSSP